MNLCEKTSWNDQTNIVQLIKYERLPNTWRMGIFFITRASSWSWGEFWDDNLHDIVSVVDIREHFAMSNLSNMSSTYSPGDNGNVSYHLFFSTCIPRECSNGSRCLTRKWCCSSLITLSISLSKVSVMGRVKSCEVGIGQELMYLRVSLSWRLFQSIPCLVQLSTFSDTTSRQRIPFFKSSHQMF